MDTLERLQTDLREATGSLPAISRAADVSYSTVLHIMRGEMQNPRYRTMLALRRALDEHKQRAARGDA